MDDIARLERAERLGMVRKGLLGAGMAFALLGLVVWGKDLRAQRKLQWSEQLAWDTYRREDLGRNMMRAHIDQSLVVPMQKEHAIAQMGLDQPRQQPPPPEPRTIRPTPPMGATAALLAALASVVGAHSVRRLHLAEIQTIADAAAARRAAKEKEQHAPAAPHPAATIQPVMPDDTP